jgi:hypothetical protein
MAAFRKKPVVIEAVQYTGKPMPVDQVPPWLFNAMLDRTVIPSPDHAPAKYLTIKTLEGNHRADIGDWIIRGVKGELYPCKPGIFAVTYEPA